jgi:hypothetical protein
VNAAAPGLSDSELRLDAPATMRISAKVAAYLPETQDEVGAYIAGRRANEKPYWDIERARIGESREVKVELIVNGHPVDSKNIEADGNFNDVAFERDVEFSSWLALRVYQSSHTNPVYVLVGDKPIRASRRSAEWCVRSVDRCWEMKKPAIRPEERPAAEAAYMQARAMYEQALAEAVAE